MHFKTLTGKKWYSVVHNTPLKKKKCIYLFIFKSSLISYFPQLDSHFSVM